jgi:hypothetical protein
VDVFPLAAGGGSAHQAKISGTPSIAPSTVERICAEERAQLVVTFDVDGQTVCASATARNVCAA